MVNPELIVFPVTAIAIGLLFLVAPSNIPKENLPTATLELPVEAIPTNAESSITLHVIIPTLPLVQGV